MHCGGTHGGVGCQPTTEGYYPHLEPGDSEDRIRAQRIYSEVRNELERILQIKGGQRCPRQRYLYRDECSACVEGKAGHFGDVIQREREYRQRLAEITHFLAAACAE